jgi:hypothetical protein
LAAVLVNTNASKRLATALQGGQAAKDYNPNKALTFIWNEVRYPPISDQAFMANFETLAGAVHQAYNQINGFASFNTINSTDEGAVQVFLNPIGISNINIMPTVQGTKLLYNTATMVMPVLQQFFFLMLMNGISYELQIYTKLPVHISGIIRVVLGLVYDLVASICMTGYISAFRESWSVNGTQFVLTWMVLWLLHHINFVLIDALTAFFPIPAAMTFILITWILMNVASSITPFEVNPASTAGLTRSQLTRLTSSSLTYGPGEVFHSCTVHCLLCSRGGL